MKYVERYYKGEPANVMIASAAKAVGPRHFGLGKAVPRLALTKVVSPTLILPSRLTSERELLLSVICPERDLVWLVSPTLVRLSSLVAPARTFMSTETLPPPFILIRVM